eukprot:s640_g10.t4
MGEKKVGQPPPRVLGRRARSGAVPRRGGHDPDGRAEFLGHFAGAGKVVGPLTIEVRKKYDVEGAQFLQWDGDDSDQPLLLGNAKDGPDTIILTILEGACRLKSWWPSPCTTSWCESGLRMASRLDCNVSSSISSPVTCIEEGGVLERWNKLCAKAFPRDQLLPGDLIIGAGAAYNSAATVPRRGHARFAKGILQLHVVHFAATWIFGEFGELRNVLPWQRRPVHVAGPALRGANVNWALAVILAGSSVACPAALTAAGGLAEARFLETWEKRLTRRPERAICFAKAGAVVRWRTARLAHRQQLQLTHNFAGCKWSLLPASKRKDLGRRSQTVLGPRYFAQRSKVAFHELSLHSQFRPYRLREWSFTKHLVARVLHEGRCHPTEPRVFVDVGALCHAHECLSKILLAETARKCGGRSGRIFVDALEPNARNFRSTKAQLLRLPRRWQRRLRLRRAAAGNTTTRATLHGTGAKASLKAEAYGGLSWSFKPSMGKIVSSADARKEQVSVIRLDSWVGARLRTHGRVEVLKIDVEGGEWEVLLGAEALLVERRVLCVVLEYSHFWAASTHITLKGLARWMSEKGYDGYLVGSPHLIPVSGVDMEWWHDLYEVCAAPDSRIYRGLAGWCWLNAAFVLRGSRLALAAQKWLPKMGKKVFEGAEGKSLPLTVNAEAIDPLSAKVLVRPVAMACSPRAALQEDAEGSCSDGEEEISPWSLWCEEAEQGVWPRDFAFLLRSRSRSPRRRPGRLTRSVEDAPAPESPPRLHTLKLERPWRQVLSPAPFAHAAAQPSQETAPLLQEEGECRECRARPQFSETWRDEGTPHAFGEGYNQKTFLATLTANPLLCKVRLKP